jgi:hypothetical protein
MNKRQVESILEIMQQFEDSFKKEDLQSFSLDKYTEMKKIKYRDEELQDLFSEFVRGYLTCFENIKKKIWSTPAEYMNDVPSIDQVI